MKERESMTYNMLELYVIEQTHIDNIVIWQSGSGEVYQTVGGLKLEKIADGIIDYIQ